MAMANGIGNGLGDFLDNTTLFASYAFTKTQPSGGHTMLGPEMKNMVAHGG